MGRTVITPAGPAPATGTSDRYPRRAGYDEALDVAGRPRPLARPLWDQLQALGPTGLAERQAAADRELLGAGVTFAVYSDGDSVDRPWPYDIVPRLVPAAEWDGVEAGLVQRLRALNAFIDDSYHDQQAVRAGVVPADLVTGSPNFRPECVGADPPGGVWAHICGSDLVRDGATGALTVLEDNLRVPSGASYLLENRVVAKRVLPELFRAYSIEPVDPYIDHLAALLRAVSPGPADPVVVVLTPGVFNAAYFEHAYLAHQLGVELVEAGDLVVTADDRLCMRTIDGLQPVDVVYRRVDDLYLDTEVFRRDSVVGVPGLVRAWRAGTVALVNAPGAGVADDKAVYGFVPELIRFFLGEEPILPNVPTYWCGHDDSCRYVLDHLAELVVKPANESGGYGVVIGPNAGPEALAQLARRIEHHPRGWVAQPVLDLSTAPTLCQGELVPRHVDLRPFTLLGPDSSYVTRGGLTRVATRAGSLIVNSSQGGGSKDTWVVDGTIGGPHPVWPEPVVRSVSAAPPPGAASASRAGSLSVSRVGSGSAPATRPTEGPAGRRSSPGSGAGRDQQ